MGESWFVVAAGVEVEMEWAMFFLAFLTRFLVILNDDFKERAIGLRRSSESVTQRKE